MADNEATIAALQAELMRLASRQTWQDAVAAAQVDRLAQAEARIAGSEQITLAALRVAASLISALRRSGGLETEAEAQLWAEMDSLQATVPDGNRQAFARAADALRTASADALPLLSVAVN